MDIAEVIIQDAKRQGIEEAEQKFKQREEQFKQRKQQFEQRKQQFEQRKQQFYQQATLNLQKRNFSNEQIAEILNLSLDELLGLIEKK